MRLIRLLIALSSVAAGVALGALNPQPVTLDLGIVVLSSTLGVVVLATLLVGTIAGGMLLAASVVAPLKQKLRRAQAAAPNPVEPGEGR